MSRAHHGRGNALFEPKFCAEGPRDKGAPLNEPMEGASLSTAAFLVHTKILWLFHSQDQRGPSPWILLALLQGRGTVAGRNGQLRANALYISYHTGYGQIGTGKNTCFTHFVTQVLFFSGPRGCLPPPQAHCGGCSVLLESEKWVNGPLGARGHPQQFFWDRPEPGTGTS